jgi:hypothetical protein
MIKESTIDSALKRGDTRALVDGFTRAAKKLIKDENLFDELVNDPFTDMSIRVPTAGYAGSVHIVFTHNTNPYSDPGSFTSGKVTVTKKSIPKDRLIVWGNCLSHKVVEPAKEFYVFFLVSIDLCVSSRVYCQWQITQFCH